QYPTNRVRWYDLLRMVLTWAVWRRPKDERQGWIDSVATTAAETVQKQEIQKMSQTIAEAWIEEGMEKGREEGELKASRKILLLQGRKRFGEPDAQTIAAIEAISDPDRLLALGGRLLDVTSWQELLASQGDS